jgi:hypothetical protein
VPSVLTSNGGQTNDKQYTRRAPLEVAKQIVVVILVSNLEFLAEAYGWYKRRFRIETFFSDQKSRGFYLGHSHISDTEHLKRLLICTCLAYLWMVCLGAWVVQTGKLTLIHRSDRCDWSLFHIGMTWIEFCLNEGLPIWIRLSLAEKEFR